MDCLSGESGGKRSPAGLAGTDYVKAENFSIGVL